jgi:deoxyribonuclease V
MDLEKLKEEQKKLAKKLMLKDDFSEPSTIAGCQIFYTPIEQITVVVLLDYLTRAVIDRKYVISTPKMPHISSFQSYRDIPSVVEAISLLSQRPEIVMYPGEGILHSRKFGPASHLGLVLDLPTIGVSKKLCVGEIIGGGIILNGEKRGSIVNTKDHAKPLYVSPGHKICLETSQRIVKSMTKEGSKLPDPLRIAHNYGLFIKKNLHNSIIQQNKIHDAALSLQA